MTRQNISSGKSGRQPISAWLLIPALAVAALVLASAVKDAGAQTSAEIVLPNEATLTIEANRGVLIRLDRPASDIFIANPEVADVQVKSPRLIYVFGKVPGETSIYALDSNEQVIYSAAIAVSQNIERVAQSITEVIPDAEISVRSINGMIILDGFARSPGEVDTALRMIRQAVGEDAEIINRIDVTIPTQVNLRVKIAEVGRGVLRQLGINWDATVFGNNALFGIATGNSTFLTIEDPITGAPVRQFLTRTGGSNSLIGSLTGNNYDLNAIVDALETEGFLSVLAEPNLTALTGETATFLAGGEFPIPIPGRGTDNLALEFKQFGVGLAFTPTVISEDRIVLRVSPEVSQLSNAGAISINGISVPSLTTRRASTTVELGSGQSFAIAGLLQSSLTQDQSKFPWLGDIPILGALFRSDKFQRQETELVIIVTPYIVRPVDARRITLPTDGILTASDADMILNGQMPGTEPRPQERLGLNGGAGFILDNDDGGEQ